MLSRDGSTTSALSVSMRVFDASVWNPPSTPMASLVGADGSSPVSMGT